MSFGATLKQAREASGLTTQELSMRTKIRGDYLRALEEQRLEVLPERTFARSYLQRYARELQLDPAPLLSEFDTVFPLPPERSTNISSELPKNAQPNSRVPTMIPKTPVVAKQSQHLQNQHLQSQNPQNQNTPNLSFLNSSFLNSNMRWIILAAVLLALLTGVLFAYNNSKKTAAIAKPALEAPATPKPAEPAAPAVAKSVKLSVTTIPEGAKIYLDNRDLGLAPIRSFPVDLRNQGELRVVLTGYQELRQTIKLNQGRNLRIQLSLTGKGPSKLVDLNALPKTIVKPQVIVVTATDGTASASGTIEQPTTEQAATPVANGVSVKFDGESWTRVTDATGKVLYQGTPPVGSVKGFPSGSVVRTGNAGVVQFSVKGSPFKPLGVVGQVITRKF